MFRAAAPGPYDEAIAKATDETLTTEDWGAILEVCDRVTTDPNGPKEVVSSLIKRLAHRNANVQLYTLEVANAVSQNCGKGMHRELSSRAFTDALLKLANDRNTHQQVKSKILERMSEWSEMFKADPDLGIMYDAFVRLKQSNPVLQPPSAPQKNSLTDVDRQKEEDELQMALKLSLQEEERKKKAAEPGPSNAGGSGAGASQAQPAPLQPMPSGTTAATVSRVRALFDFVPSEPGELEFKKGDVIAVLESVYKDWWRGSLKGKTGIFPLNYVEKLTDPTPDELQREAQMEAEVFAEIKNVEKLLTLLSTSNTAPREEDNEEISKLYHQTLAIRPKLIKLIEKYSQKKDDFTQLNEKFIKARRDYEALLESSMSHPPHPTYHQYAMRPQVPQGYQSPAPNQGYPTPAPVQNYPTPGPSQGFPQQQTPGPQQQDPQRFYTPAPQQEQAQYLPQSTPSPNFQRPPPGATPAPFYMAGAEVPAARPQNGPPQHNQQHQVQQQQQQSQQHPQHQQHSQPSQQPQQHPQMSPSAQQHHIPQQHQQQQQQGHGPSAPSQQQQQSHYPPRDQVLASGARLPLNGKGPTPIQTSPPPNSYTAYQPPNQRPHSAYVGGPQELSTSAYDSPVTQHNPNPMSAATYSSSVYSVDDPARPGPEPSAPAQPEQKQNPTYQPYTAYHAALQNQQHQQRVSSPQGQAPQQAYSGAGYGPSDDAESSHPPPPTSQAPPPPGSAPPPPPGQILSPPPLQPNGPAYDARQSLPSRAGGTPGAGPQQYKAYVPPGPSAPPGAGGPEDGPSAPADYYRNAPY